jgi:hypothetical protein
MSFEKEWMECPDEIKQLENRKGARNYSFAVHVNSLFETQEICDLFCFVRSALKGGRLSLEAAKSFFGTVLIEKGDKMARYYKIKELPNLFKEAGSVLPKALSVEEFVQVIDSLLLYVARYNSWLDRDLDWSTLSETHQRLREKKGLI